MINKRHEEGLAEKILYINSVPRKHSAQRFLCNSFLFSFPFSFLVTYFKGCCHNCVDIGSFTAMKQEALWKSRLQSQEQREQGVACWLQHSLSPQYRVHWSLRDNQSSWKWGWCDTGNCRSCEHKNIRHFSKKKKLLGWTHLVFFLFLLILSFSYFQHLSQYSLSSETNMLLYIFYSICLFSKAFLLVYSHLPARICSKFFSLF